MSFHVDFKNSNYCFVRLSTVDTVFPLFSQVQRHPGPPYTAHEINKGHPNLAATLPGHASSPGLSQSPYTPGQNAGTTPLVYSSPTQPMNAQPQSRPFFQRTQMQTVRPTIPSNNPPIRPTSQTPTAAVYPPSQPIMMTMAPMPFHSPQTAQYYIPQYRHSAPQYVGPPQQYPVQPTGPSTFYAGPSPGDFPAPYGPPYYPGQPIYSPSPSIIVPTPQQPPPAKREKKTIRIRDPNQGGKDVTEEILSGVVGSRNPTPPVGRPSSTPTPPRVRRLITETKSNTKTHMQTPLERRDPSSPVQAPSPPQKTELPPSGPESASSVATAPTPSIPASTVESADTPSPSAEPGPTKAITPEPESSEPEKSYSEQLSPQSLSTSLAQPEKVINGLTDTDAAPLSEDLESQPREVSPLLPTSSVPQCPSSEPRPITPALEAESAAGKADTPSPPAEDSTGCPVAPSLSTSTTAAISTTPAPPPGLTHPSQVSAGSAKRPSTGAELKETGKETEALPDERGEPFLQSRKSSSQGEQLKYTSKMNCHEEDMDQPSMEPAAESPSPPPVEVERRPSAGAVLEENGEQEVEPLRNGAEHASETENSDMPRKAISLQHSLVSHVCLPEPAEKNGKKQYDRDFLLGFQFMPACVQKPEGLPPISDVVLDKINQNKLPMRPVDPRVISRGPDFTPAFADFGRQIPGGRGAPLLNVSLRRPPGRKIITNVSVNDEVQLRTTENAWKPGMKRENAIEEPETLKSQELFRKVRSILNKLTPQMFSQLMKQVTDLTIDTEERLKGVIDLVFEKAIDEPSFSVAYGNMCSCLATLKVPMMDKPNSTVNFRKLLLNRCQKEFEKDKVDDDVFEKKHRELEAANSASERERLQEELNEAKDKARRRSIGNIKFIGELFKLRMLTEAIMHDCVVKLLKNHDEESLECLCRLLTTIGKDLDFEKAKPRMDQYFNQMEKIVKEKKTSSRIRFMLQDVTDLRLHNWVSRRADLGPKTIEQIHKEAKLEEQEEKRKVHQQLLSKDNKRRPVVQREETWSTVPMTKNSRTIDPAKILKISKPTIDEKIQLGPRAQVNWMKGSSGGAGAKASESGKVRLMQSGMGYWLCQFQLFYSLCRIFWLYTSFTNVKFPPFFPVLHPFSFRCLSRGSSGRERNDKPLSAGPARTGPISLGSSNKEAPEESVQEVSRRDSNASDTPKLPASTADKTVKLEVLSGPSPDKPTLTEEDMERRSKSIIDEFLHINDYKEAVQCVEELEQPAMLYVFVRVGVESTLERSQITRDHMGQLLYQLLQAGIFHKLQFFKGFSETLELADDMAIDIPHIWLYLAELVTPVLREGGISMRELFSEFSKPLLPVGRAGILFSEILHLLCKQMSHRKVGSLWRDSGLSWADFIPETEDVHSFITEHKLDFTLSDGSNPTEAVSKRTLSPEELNKQLEKLLLEDMAGDERIFDWVEANLDESEMSSPPFLRALMTAVCKAAVKTEGSSYKVDLSIIKRRLPVLHKYLNSDTERQLQALYALQALIVKLDQPANLLRMFFDCLYDEDVISEDAFYKWEVSKDPAEQQGKGVALKSVTAFFTWLREAEEESEDN
uniref:Eukaryotic translation initiation factor 4 gamma 3-like n=1 Tax=Sinocyclocheilus anshuiensis TaxID=1608454 RepID=A0A671PGA0_9TELE